MKTGANSYKFTMVLNFMGENGKQSGAIKIVPFLYNNAVTTYLSIVHASRVSSLEEGFSCFQVAF